MGLLDRWRRERWTDTVFQALDLEATGLDPRRAEILSIGLVPIRGGVIRWGERWYRPLRPPASVDAGTEAIKVHGLLPGELETAPPVAEVLPELARRLEGAVLVVHWGRFDLPLLRRAFERAQRPWPRTRIVDTADLLGRLDRRRRLIEPSPRPIPTQLAAARAFLGLPPHSQHHALYDALATAELLLALRARLGLEHLG